MGGSIGEHTSAVLQTQKALIHDYIPVAAAVWGLELYFPRETLASWETVPDCSHGMLFISVRNGWPILEADDNNSVSGRCDT